DEALAEVVWVSIADGIPNYVEALFVKGLGGPFRISPVSRSDIGAFEAQHGLVAVGHELDCHAGCRQADVPGLRTGPGCGEGEGRRFSRTIAGDDHHTLACLHPRSAVEAIEDMLRKARARILQELQACEEVAPRLRVFIE